MHVIWSKEYELGIKDIDAQHLRIVDYINQLDDAISLPAPDRQMRLSRALKGVADYTKSHFDYEESLQEAANYPFVDAHKKVHELFIRRVDDYVRRFTAGENITAEFRDTLERWLLSHIKHEDAGYTPYVKKSLSAAKPKPSDAATASLWQRLFKRNK